jgi:hypothetical protein
VCLDNPSLGRLFAIREGGLTCIVPTDSVREAFCAELGPPAPPVSSQRELEEALQEFLASGGEERFIRGKYLMWFFVEFARDVHRNLPTYLPRYQKSPRVRVPFDHGTSMTLVGARARAPVTLRRFVQRTFNTTAASEPEAQG